MNSLGKYSTIARGGGGGGGVGTAGTDCKASEQILQNKLTQISALQGHKTIRKIIQKATFEIFCLHELVGCPSQQNTSISSFLPHLLSFPSNNKIQKLLQSFPPTFRPLVSMPRKKRGCLYNACAYMASLNSCATAFCAHSALL